MAPKEMQVCDVCGALRSKDDASQRVEEHPDRPGVERVLPGRAIDGQRDAAVLSFLFDHVVAVR